MLSICLDCTAKHFTAGRPARVCESCGSRRLAVISSAALLRPRMRAGQRAPHAGTPG